MAKTSISRSVNRGGKHIFNDCDDVLLYVQKQSIKKEHPFRWWGIWLSARWFDVVWHVWKQWKSYGYGTDSHWISTQLNIYSTDEFVSDVFNHFHQNKILDLGNIFWRKCIHLSRDFFNIPTLTNNKKVICLNLNFISSFYIYVMIEATFRKSLIPPWSKFSSPVYALVCFQELGLFFFISNHSLSMWLKCESLWKTLSLCFLSIAVRIVCGCVFEK